MEKRTITGLKKREQIKNANQAMFLWVVVASVVVAICLVLGQFMVRQMLYNNEVIAAKNKAYDTLVDNKEAFEGLKNEVNKLTSSNTLTALRVDEKDTALQVVIDALPTSDDRAALATSLQQVVLAQSGVTIESINVIDAGLASVTLDDEESAGDAEVGEIPFTVVLLGDYNRISQALKDMERTIRPISLESVEIEGGGTQLRATVNATTYFLPAKTIEYKMEKL